MIEKKESTAVILARIDERLKRMEKIEGQTLEQATKTNGRVRALENWKNILIGAIGIIGVIIGWVLTIIGSY